MNQEHLEFMKVYQIDKKIRLGIKQDGGYVIADLSGGYDCYISAGVGREESFSKEFIEKYGMHEFNSFGIDSSIEAYPIEYTNNISFIKKNISNINDSSNTNLRYLTTIYKNIFLKIDIEGGEYGWIMDNPIVCFSSHNGRETIHCYNKILDIGKNCYIDDLLILNPPEKKQEQIQKNLCIRKKNYKFITKTLSHIYTLSFFRFFLGSAGKYSYFYEQYLKKSVYLIINYFNNKYYDMNKIYYDEKYYTNDLVKNCNSFFKNLNSQK
jgi:hypothetical protein